MFSLEGKTAVVTGAGSGIGAAVAETLFRAGARVALLARTGETVREAASRLDPSGGKAKGYGCDVRSEAEVETCRDRVAADFGGIDILVTCAAAPAAAGRTESLSFEDWRTVLGTDLDGVFLSLKHFGGEMVRRGAGGRIVNLTSFHNVATYPERAAYNAAKSGVEGLTRALAVEWGCRGITVNAVAPGPIRTPRTSWFLSQSPDVEAGMTGRTPSARIGETGDVASLVAFLCTDEARHINGQQVVVDGGWTKCAWWGRHERK